MRTVGHGRRAVPRGAMKLFVRAGILVSLLAGLVFAPGEASVQAANPTASSANASVGRVVSRGIDYQLVRRLDRNARGRIALSSKNSTNFAAFIRASRGGDLFPASRSRTPRSKALGFFARYGGLLGIRDASAELVRTSSFVDRYGSTHLSYRQVYRGVPVFGGVLRAHFDARSDLTAVNGVFVPDIRLGTKPRLGAGAAKKRAIAQVIARPPAGHSGLRAADLSAESAKLYVYRTGLIRNVRGTNQLVYEVRVTNGRDVREVVFVHAHAGKVVNRFSLINDGLFRRLFEQNTSNQVWQEGDPFPGTLNQDQQNIVNFSGQTYRHFFNAFGRDSYDGAGHEMRSVNNDPRIACPNANWNGATTNYCNGVTADDVVAHEWEHAYTQFTHNLIYQWQPGALNEAYSDIFGETVDVLNGEGTDTPNPIRSAGGCSTHTTPVPVLVINSPPPIAGECAAAGASFGPPLSAAGVTGNVVLADDGVGVTTDACTPLVNAAQITGNIALVDRGTCTFVVKVKNAQNAGAIAVVVGNNIVGPPSPMAGTDPTITVPSVMISLSHRNLIVGQLGTSTVNVTMRRGGGVTEDSYRWLLAEDSTAFGGAIRDMWNPRCLSDPGKVTDSEYQCAATDNGGVHTNSGVPNHGFALLVDGGTYNGRTVGAIGLVKAAHLYWRAQSVYQTPTSDFDDHADALQASCTDLIGVNLTGLSTGAPVGPSGEVISAADCAAVTNMIAAVELRTDPSAQCNFQPLLRQNPPALCPSQKNPPIHYAEDFEDGLVGWTLTNQGVYSGWPNLNWVQATTLPGGRAGAAAFGADPDIGNCDGGAGDVSGVMRMESPAILIPATNILSTRLTFQHYVATEAGWDGGNLKISINGGPYFVVPASAYLFNPYNATLNPPEAGNTNPLAGQPGFTGTDGGKVTGSWGESQVNLSHPAVGVDPGDTIRLRFDLGMDGCTGVDGWYVDDVKVRSCNLKKNPTARES
jgi:Zn-dependent metalloprotease